MELHGCVAVAFVTVDLSKRFAILGQLTTRGGWGIGVIVVIMST